MFDIVSIWSTAKRVLTFSHLTFKLICHFSFFISIFDFPFLHYFSTAQICLICDQFDPEGEESLINAISVCGWKSMAMESGNQLHKMPCHVGNELVIKIALYIHMYAHVCVLSMHVCSTCPNKSDKSWVEPSHKEALNAESNLKLFE